MVYPKVSGLSHNGLNNSNTRWEATQRVMAAKLTRLTHKIAIQLHLVAESPRWPVRELLDTPSYWRNVAHIKWGSKIRRYPYSETTMKIINVCDGWQSDSRWSALDHCGIRYFPPARLIANLSTITFLKQQIYRCLLIIKMMFIWN
jgi:hypothetical protein